MTSGNVRPAVDGDAAGVALLLAELGYPAHVDEVRARIETFNESETDEVLVAMLDERVVGLATLNLAPMFAEGGMFARITALVVSKDHRGQGVARRLVRAVEERARSAGCTLIQVSSGRRPERAAAHRFYARLGLLGLQRAPRSLRAVSWFPCRLACAVTCSAYGRHGGARSAPMMTRREARPVAGRKIVPVKRYKRSTPSDPPYPGPGKKPGPKTVPVVPHKRTPPSK